MRYKMVIPAGWVFPLKKGQGLVTAQFDGTPRTDISPPAVENITLHAPSGRRRTKLENEITIAARVTIHELCEFRWQLYARAQIEPVGENDGVK